MTYARATLEMCERHVLQGERRILDQIERIARLEARGLPTETALALLMTFKDTQAMAVQHRDRVRADLASRGRDVPL